jgi:predicted TIM-barrel fold metal-dependent hydrolase
LWPRGRAELELITGSLGVPTAHSFHQWLEICEEVFRRSQSAVALKLAHAYVCSLAHTRPTFGEAESVFNRIERRRELFGVDETLGWQESQPLRDYLVHHLIRLAIRYNLPVQIHTGLLENTYNDVRDSHPHHLIPLLLEYREARFVLFHGGYPWLREFIALGKSFPNVWLDLCWLWIISPRAARNTLHELIETIPANKVCAFGGDYLFIEGTYGHSVLARQGVSQVLTEKLGEGWFTETQAMAYAQAVMHDNAAALYCGLTKTNP